MNIMPAWVKEIGDWIIWVGGIAAVLGVLYRWIIKPLRIIQADTADILCDRLTQAHDYHMRKGFCPKVDKSRLCAMHQRYRSLGRNHLVDSYEQDLLDLPDEPARK